MENSSTQRGLSNSPTHHHYHRLNKSENEIPNDESENPIFPEEIFMEILVRLPVKTLMKFRCVSKSWLLLISTPQFIKSHLKISSKEPSFSNMRVMITNSKPRFSLKYCSAHSLISSLVTYPLDIDYPTRNMNRYVRVVGSCNGLVCIAFNDIDLFFWNPITRMSYKLPSANVKVNTAVYNVYGFGYDDSNDDYKVFGIFCAFEQVGMIPSMGRMYTIVKVYSLINDSWKRIEDFKDGIPAYEPGKLVAGKIHFATDLDFDLDRNIVSLDLKSEVYGGVEQPNYVEGVTGASLAVLGGCLSVLSYYATTHVDLWVLKEYGVKESWTKVATIPYFKPHLHSLYSNPLCMLPNGDILLVFESRFVVYNVKEFRLRSCGTGDMDRFIDANIIIESLVSPIPNARLMTRHQ